MLVDSNLGIKIAVGSNLISFGGLIIFVYFFIFGMLFNQLSIGLQFLSSLIVPISLFIGLGFIILKPVMEVKEMIVTSVVNVIVLIGMLFGFIFLVLFTQI
jgi:hypothetical protein